MAAGGTLRPRRTDPGQPGERPPLRLVLTVAAWLGTGTALAGLNKWIFAAHGFRYPLLLSSLHMLAAVALGYPLGWVRGPPPPVRPRARIYLLSLTFCGSVALGNLGLSLVPLDAAQAVRPAGHPAAVGAAAGPPAPPAAIRGHGARLRRGRVQHRRRCPLPPARGLRPPGCHRPACPQVPAAE